MFSRGKSGLKLAWLKVSKHFQLENVKVLEDSGSGFVFVKTRIEKK
jgi:hypothetical protein